MSLSVYFSGFLSLILLTNIQVSEVQYTTFFNHSKKIFLQNIFENAASNFGMIGRQQCLSLAEQSKAPHSAWWPFTVGVCPLRACTIPITLCVIHHRGQQHCLGNFSSHQPGALPGDPGAESGEGLGCCPWTKQRWRPLSSSHGGELDVFCPMVLLELQRHQFYSTSGKTGGNIEIFPYHGDSPCKHLPFMLKKFLFFFNTNGKCFPTNSVFVLSHFLQAEGKLCRTELYFPFENESSTAVRRLSCWCVSGDRKNYSAQGLTYFFIYAWDLQVLICCLFICLSYW